jgi:hypothetical protein
MPVQNQSPYHIIMYPFDVWSAIVGTAEPSIDLASVPGPWSLLSTSGKADQSDEGVKVNHPQKFEQVRGQRTAIRKVSRTEEDFIVEMEVMDVSMKVYAMALNSNTTTNTSAASGVAGKKRLSVYRGPNVNYIALLMRGFSPSSPDGNGYRQIWIPKCYQSAEPEVKYSKTGASMIKLTYTAVEGPNYTEDDADLGYITDYVAAPL